MMQCVVRTSCTGSYWGFCPSRMRCLARVALSIALGVLQPHSTWANPVRLKDLVSLEGVRDNQLIGYGIVVGLNQTGDRRQTVFTVQSLTNLLQQMGVQVNPSAIRVSNTAAVMVTATLPPFAQPGTKLDVTVAAMGDASNLQGGLLLLSNLRAADGNSYGIAQGPVVTGGFVAGAAGTKETKNHPTTGRIPSGATVERGSPSIAPKGSINLQLRYADFTTASRIADAVNKKFAEGGAEPALAANSALVRVNVPQAYLSNTVRFISDLESLVVNTDTAAKVVVNERTGTIVLGKQLRIGPVAILHGSLSIQIDTTFNVSQPAPFSQGQTAVTPQVGVAVKEEKAQSISLKDGATVEELVRALLAIGSTPRDIIAILQNLRSAGALDADLEVI
jgi:flagellar P-ring protein FlgI